jgi:hypothetical protein
MHWLDFPELLFTSDEQSLARLRARCGETPQPDEQRIADYLGADLGFVGIGCIADDRLDGGPLQRGIAYCSDGSWIWCNVVAHYVRRHHFRVPDEFARHVAARDGRPPRREEVDWDRVLDEYHRARAR